jgi:hypothetical protein
MKHRTATFYARFSVVERVAQLNVTFRQGGDGAFSAPMCPVQNLALNHQVWPSSDLGGWFSCYGRSNRADIRLRGIIGRSLQM